MKTARKTLVTATFLCGFLSANTYAGPLQDLAAKISAAAAQKEKAGQDSQSQSATQVSQGPTLPELTPGQAASGAYVLDPSTGRYRMKSVQESRDEAAAIRAKHETAEKEATQTADAKQAEQKLKFQAMFAAPDSTGLPAKFAKLKYEGSTQKVYETADLNMRAVATLMAVGNPSWRVTYTEVQRLPCLLINKRGLTGTAYCFEADGDGAFLAAIWDQGTQRIVRASGDLHRGMMKSQFEMIVKGGAEQSQ